MSETIEHVTRRYRLQHTTGRPIAFWGVILLATTEGMLFAVLLFSWFYLWVRTAQWPPAGVELPELAFSGFRSVILLSTSATIWAAERAVHRGDQRAAWNWTAITVVGAGFFLVTHIYDFVVTIPNEFLWSDHAYGSMWWTLLNLHGAHVAVGILIWVFILVRWGDGPNDGPPTTHFATAAIYWHFVDVVWVFVYTSLYLLPHVLAAGG